MIPNIELFKENTKQTLEQKLIQCHDQRLISDIVFWYFSTAFDATSASVISFESQMYECHEDYVYGDKIQIEKIPEAFWLWAAQFSTSDGLVSISNNTIGWDYQQILPNETFLFVLDSHTFSRTYLIVQSIYCPLIESNKSTKLDFLYIAASQWQCIRAEKNASNEIRLRDIKAAKYLDEIKERDLFLEKMKLVQHVSIKLSKPETLDSLFQAAVEAVRDDMGFDRSVFMLLDYKQRSFSSTYGTDESGNTISEHHKIYDLHQLEPSYIEALYNSNKTLVVVDPAPLYTAGEVVGEGWNAMLILRDENSPVGWIALDNFIHREPMTIYQQEMLKSFAALLSQIYIRKRREQSIKLLNMSLVEFSRCQSLNDVCYCAVSFAIKYLGVDRLGILLTNENCTSLKGTWGTDQQGNVVNESYFYSENLEVVQEAIEQPETLIYTDSSPIFHDLEVIGFGAKGIALIQTTDKKPFAFVVLDNFLTKKSLSTEEQEIINLFISTLSEVLQRTQAMDKLAQLNRELELKIRERTNELENVNKKLEILSLQDPLTKLGNRRQFEKYFKQALSDSHITNMAVLLIDIDFFGLYNNSYGHLQGDKALLKVSRILHDTMNEIAVTSFCRIGGEEFAVCLPNQTLEEIEALSFSIQDRLEEKNIEHNLSSVSPRLTISIGGIITDKAIENIDEIYHQADIQLYKAKEKRNTVCCRIIS